MASNQQHLLTVTNDAAAEDAVQLPFLLTRVRLPGRPGGEVARPLAVK